MNPAEILQELFDAALRAADPMRCVPPYLPKPPKGKTIVVGAGKAAAAMARAVEEHWQGNVTGLVVTRYGHGVACKKIEVLEAAHPVPDAAALSAANKILSLVHGLSEDDLVLFLGSGGGSSLLSLPLEGLELGDKQAITHKLLACGAPISEINCVRKHLSALKGGRLALAAAPARVQGILISDVPNDDPAIIASGPTVPDPTTREDARAVLARYDFAISKKVKAILDDPRSETPKPGDLRFACVENVIVATAKDALNAAACKSKEFGLRAILVGHDIEGSARDIACSHAERVRAIMNEDDSKKCVLLSGGEVTVALEGGGRGGPNTEFLLALASTLGPMKNVWAIACDTDGIDGSGDNAGAFLSPDTLQRASSRGLDPREYLARNDSYRFFEALDALVRTGPTRTNVNDFRAILID